MPRAFSVPMESQRALDSSFDAFSLREPASTSLENALAQSNATRTINGTLSRSDDAVPDFRIGFDVKAMLAAAAFTKLRVLVYGLCI
ncbi:hypothetical protein [Bradyrhizobium sp. LTSPM299]|uniref:hypothetical protein n=1 Tax=Bradyrhizobium sp. LTSPM299 TaxID=1619233 RepID=UPI0012E0F686|nr:hypothetical protein [Bradyrhizobium sp. LTSPM299]